MNSYIQSNAAGATDTAHFTSCVSTLDDSEDNINAGPGDKKTDDEEEEAALDVAEGNIQKKWVSVLSCFLHQFIYDMNSYFKRIHVLTFVLNEFIYKMNSYIYPTVKVGDTIEYYAPEAVVGDLFNIY
jgi:hypothetical protein